MFRISFTNRKPDGGAPVLWRTSFLLLFSGEHMTGFEEGRPLFVRSPESKFTLANFMRNNLYTCLGAMRVGLDILLNQEQVKIDKLLGRRRRL